MKNTIRMCLNDAAQGDKHSLTGLIDILIELDIDLARILEIAKKHFGIPQKVALNTILDIM